MREYSYNIETKEGIYYFEISQHGDDDFTAYLEQRVGPWPIDAQQWHKVGYASRLKEAKELCRDYVRGKIIGTDFYEK